MSHAPRVVVLGGGLGGARLAAGLRHLDLLASSRVVVNVADDVDPHGLRVCPDLDTVLYTLAGLFDEQRGWGRRDESFVVMQAMERLGAPQWFGLGDRDLATHLVRTELLRAGQPLSAVTAALCGALDVPASLTPVTDDEVRTRVLLEGGEEVDFQTFHVRLSSRPTAVAVRYDGLVKAAPAPGVVESLLEAGLVVVAPSSPVASVLPVLGVAGVRDALRRRTGPTVAVTPVVAALPPGPDAEHRARTRQRLLAAIGVSHDAPAVAGLYGDLVDAFVVDRADWRSATVRLPSGVEPLVGDTITRTPDEAARLLGDLLSWAG